MKKHPFKKMSGIITIGILSFAMIFGGMYLMPMTVKGASAGEYDLWVAGTQVTNDNADNILSGDETNNGKVSYDPDTNTLTLSGANIEYQAEATAAEAARYAVYSKDMDFTIVLQGENTVTVTSEVSGTADSETGTSVIYCENGNLSINGPGSLDAFNRSMDQTDQIRFLYTIYSDKKLTMTGCKVTAQIEGSIKGIGNTTNEYSAAVYAMEEISVSDSELTAECGVEVLEGDVAAVYTEKGMEIIDQSNIRVISNGDGVYCTVDSPDFDNNISFLNIDNSVMTVQAEAVTDYFRGIYVDGRISVKNDAEVLVEGSAPGGEIYGVTSDWLDIDNGALTVNADNADGVIGVDAGPEKKTDTPGGYEQYGFGIKVTNNGTLAVNVGTTEGGANCIFAMDIDVDNNGSITAKSSDASSDSSGASIGIWSFTDIRLKDSGTITVQAGNAKDMSYGILVFGDGKFEQSGGTVTAQAGTSDSASAICFVDEEFNPRVAYVLNQDEWDFAIKAGQNETSAQTIDAVMDDIWTNAYVRIEHLCRHEWSETWSSDETHHWHDCTKQNCTVTEDKDKDGYAEHTPNQDDGDCATSVLCPVCQGVITPAQEHEFGTVNYHDAEGHWQQCVHDGCTQTSQKQNHTFIEGTPNPAPTYEAEGRRIDTCVCGETKIVVLPKLVNGSAPQLSVVDGGMYCEATIVTVTDDNLDMVTLNGEPVTLINGQFTVFPLDKVQTITAVNKAGEKTTVSITINAEHTWDEGKIVTLPTETTEGVKLYTCGDCGQTKSEAVAKLESEDEEENEDEGESEQNEPNGQTLKSPSTKDTSNTAGGIAILLLSGSGLAGMYIYSRKKAF